MKKILIVYYSYTGGTQQLAKAACGAANSEDAVEVRLMRAEDCETADILAADGYIFAFPENLAAIAGVMKAFFDRCYYPCLGKIEGRPYAMLVCAGSDGENAVRQAERIATGWRLKRVMDSQIICTHAQSEAEILAPKTIGEADLDKARETGAALAAGLDLGIF